MPLTELLRLSHELGREERRLAILGEGNTSMRLDAEHFAIKASGSALSTLNEEDVVICRFDRVLPLLSAGSFSDQEIDTALYAARTTSSAKKPSVEAIFHAALLTLPGVNFVGHTHPISVNQILCSKKAGAFATQRLFPDEIVCCGPESVLVPYTDPGLPLARSIKSSVDEYIAAKQETPRIILLGNHGLIAIGSSPAAVLAGSLMSAKAAEIFAGAAVLSGTPSFLSASQVTRIAGRPDEHHRRKMLGL